MTGMWPDQETLVDWSVLFLRERALPLLSGAEERPGQVQMAAGVARALAEGRVLLCEAGTGTGKSLAYLIPAVGLAKAAGKPVIVSTSSIPLQQQLLEKDLPLLAAAWPEPVRVALAKGRGNYVCLRKADDVLGQLSLFEGDRALREWLSREDCDGDLRHVPAELQEEAARIAGDETCTGRQCSLFRRCYYFRARRAWQEADLILCNHALLMADLVQRRGGLPVLPDAAAIIVDEAHDLEDAALSAFERTLSEQGLARLVRALLSSRLVRESPPGWQQAWKQHATTVMAAATAYFQTLARDAATRAYDPSAVEAEERELRAELGEALKMLQEMPAPTDEAQAEVETFGRCFEDALGVLDAAREADGEREVGWVRVAEGRSTLHVSPLRVDDVLGQELVGRGVPVVFTSATLTVGRRFDSFARRVGVRQARVLLVPSPFDYRRQRLLWIPPGMPDPNDPTFASRAVAVIAEVIEAMGGRTLCLFTSHAAMRAAAEVLRATIPYPILCQGDADRAELLALFREQEESVLLGTGSFWQGVDVAGASLSCVIIERLPFAVPDDPVQRARHAQAERAGLSPFWEVSLPEAVVRFRQGVGRLIRSRRDRGLLVILDPRVRTRRYGRVFLESLEGFQPVASLEQAAAQLGLREHQTA
ncbi:MAG TPA: ATP-dependent DNA helicase [Thermaerobacter sp.]